MDIYKKLLSMITFLFNKEIVNQFEEFRKYADNYYKCLNNQQSFDYDKLVNIYQTLLTNISNYNKLPNTF